MFFVFWKSLSAHSRGRLSSIERRCGVDLLTVTSSTWGRGGEWEEKGRGEGRRCYLVVS